MNKLIVLTVVGVAVAVYGKNSTSILKNSQYDKLKCTVCKAVNQFTSVSSKLTDDITIIVDYNFTLDSNVR